MSTLFWPGDHRAGELFSDRSLVETLVAVERAWLAALVDTEIAPASAHDELADLVDATDLPLLTERSEASGNPVLPVLELLRGRLTSRNADAARWLHKGLTSQDVLDTALVLLTRDTRGELRRALATQLAALVHLVDEHRHVAMAGRTLGRPAVPITVGAKVSGWTQGLLDAADALDALVLPVQFGGAAGNRSGAATLASDAGTTPSLLAEAFARRLALVPGPPWQTARAPVTAIADALVGVTTACGRIANDVLTLSRPEIGELTEAAADGRGRSSTMPQKSNPVLSILIRRAALTAPALGSLVHLAAADVRDERPDGAWHVEWQPLQLLARHALAAASQAAELLIGLDIDAAAAARNLAAARPGIDAERGSLGVDVTDDAVVGDDDELIDTALARARAWLGAPA
ncbi:lyase family protein [uncultured Jatrophihabitans sp.]|uniref:lyase family protein n=1 Tax=uncultured Jatrophihabitans sp. TaxID=1610747 RepID=UPI0035CBD267